ncbi:hypothetical protein SAMN05421812_103386 [Asanoa hainanensis]|uniref:Uncharacterized protein n=1 Tax=Asanoa hainanensis TaxID=560556 RepID=A0A239K9K6_9ACTN|nr:hypothetical protein [Asanoa hainanensis]SNT14650.1 hypothetical protein SAMN05421812_103386 [Asanoa hainanensis]
MSETPAEPAPATLRAAVWLLFAEAAGMVALTVYLAYELLTADAVDITSALLLTLFAAFGALALFLLGRALTQGRAGARGPAIVLQLMLCAVGYYMIQGGTAWLGVVAIALGLGVCGLMLAPASTRGLGVGR